MLEPEGHAEAVVKRLGEETGAGRRADERERRQVERDRACAGALAKDDGQAAVLHGRVERLLDGRVEAVDLVDEEHGTRLK